MKAYMMNTTTPSSEADIKAEINTFGYLTWRDTTITVMFANLDTTQSQTITVQYSQAYLNSLISLFVIGVTLLAYILG